MNRPAEVGRDDGPTVVSGDRVMGTHVVCGFDSGLAKPMPGVANPMSSDSRGLVSSGGVTTGNASSPPESKSSSNTCVAEAASRWPPSARASRARVMLRGTAGLSLCTLGMLLDACRASGLRVILIKSMLDELDLSDCLGSYTVGSSDLGGEAS